MIGVGQGRQELTDEEATKTAALWGLDPVHPTGAAYHVMADSLETDFQNQNCPIHKPRKAEPGNEKSSLKPQPVLSRVGQRLLSGPPEKGHGPLEAAERSLLQGKQLEASWTRTIVLRTLLCQWG